MAKVVVPNNLKKLRLERNMTQYQLATKLGVMLATFSNWETGKRNLPIERAQELASILNVDWKDLFES